jgi:hypothetical protein
MIHNHELPIDEGAVDEIPAIAEGIITAGINILDMTLRVDLSNQGRVE